MLEDKLERLIEDDALLYAEQDGLWSLSDVQTSSSLLINDISNTFPDGAKYKYSGSPEKLNISIGKNVCGAEFQNVAEISDDIRNLLKNIFNEKTLLMHVKAAGHVLECTLEI